MHRYGWQACCFGSRQSKNGVPSEGSADRQTAPQPQNQGAGRSMQAARVNSPRGGSSEAHLASYAKVAVSYPRLTREDEIQLAEEVAKGSDEAVHRLVLSNLYLVIRIARNYRRQNTSLLDLINEGNIGLLKAARKFNPQFGIRFSSYASWWIKQRISIYLIQHTKGAISIPIRKVLQLYNLNRESQQLQNQLHRRPTVEELATSMRTTPQSVQETMNLIPEYLNIDDCLGAATTNDVEAGRSSSVGHLASVPSTVERSIQHKTLQSSLGSMLDVLSEREREGVKLFFGLTGGEEMNYAALGRQLKISREGARQLIKRSIEKLRAHPKANLLKEYLVA